MTFFSLTAGSPADEAEYFEKLSDLERNAGRSTSRLPTAALVEELLHNDERLALCRRREEAARLKRGDPAFARGIEPLERELREAERKSPAFLKHHQVRLYWLFPLSRSRHWLSCRRRADCHRA